MPTLKLFNIQILRALAALGVVIHHTLEASNGAASSVSPNWLTTSGASGVDIFFVISGFIMPLTAFPANRPPSSALQFLIQRATRIYPLYWLASLGIVLIAAAGFLKHHHFTSSDILASILLLPGNNKLVSVAWTLVYEIYFYLIFAVTLLRRSLSVSLIATVAFIISAMALARLASPGTLVDFLKNPIPLEFCYGLAIFWITQRSALKSPSAPASKILLIVSFALLFLAPAILYHVDTSGLSQITRGWAWGLPAALIVYAAVNLESPAGHLSRTLILLGDASYALYLSHVFVIIGYGRLLKIPMIAHMNQMVWVPVIVCLAVGLGVITHLYIERPLLRLTRALIRPETAGSIIMG